MQIEFILSSKILRGKKEILDYNLCITHVKLINLKIKKN